MDESIIANRIDKRLPRFALKLIESLEEVGFEAYFVGGFIRDAILERDAYDIDITTDALWHEVRNIALSAGFKTYETGVKHGTITVIDPQNDMSIEVTTYRIDGQYKDSRHPDEVRFTSCLLEDLARRDFTMNAIAYNPKLGLKDPFDGIKDIKDKTIRVVGDGRKRFMEDGLRILRAARFASQLGFTIEENTYTTALESKHVLRHVSTERITHEIDCMLLGDHILDALMRTVDIISFVLPELVAMKNCAQVTKYHIYDVLRHTAHVVQASNPTRLNRWVALCHDMGKPASAFFDESGIEHFYGHAYVSENIARGMLKRLLMSPSFIDDVCTLVRYHDIEIAPTKRSVKRMLQKLDGKQELMRALLDIKRADAKGQAPMCASRLDEIDDIESIFEDVIHSNEAFTVKNLAIDGRDLMDIGFLQGPLIGQTLNAALEKVIDEEINNERDELLIYASSLLKSASENKQPGDACE